MLVTIDKKDLTQTFVRWPHISLWQSLDWLQTQREYTHVPMYGSIRDFEIIIGAGRNGDSQVYFNTNQRELRDAINKLARCQPFTRTPPAALALAEDSRLMFSMVLPVCQTQAEIEEKLHAKL